MTKVNSTTTVMLYATVDTFNMDRGATALATGVCAATGGALTAYLLSLDGNVPPSSSGRSYQQICDDFDVRQQQNLANAKALVHATGQRGIDTQTVTTINHVHGVAACVADQARLHDVVVIGSDGSGLMSHRMIAEHLLFEIGRPMLIAPADFAGEFSCKRIVVAWDNSRVAARALGDALRLFPDVSDVVLLTIGDEKNVRSSLDHAQTERTLMRHGVEVRMVTKQLAGRSIGDALQESARELDAGLLVMGGYGHSRLRDFVLGGATLSVLAHPRLPILMSH